MLKEYVLDLSGISLLFMGFSVDESQLQGKTCAAIFLTIFFFFLLLYCRNFCLTCSFTLLEIIGRETEREEKSQCCSYLFCFCSWGVGFLYFFFFFLIRNTCVAELVKAQRRLRESSRVRFPMESRKLLF